MKIELVHIDLIRVGDIVIHDGKPRTICPRKIKRNTFMGTTLWGDSYRLGTVPVKRVILSYPTKYSPQQGLNQCLNMKCR